MSLGRRLTQQFMKKKFSEKDVARYWDKDASSWSAQVRRGWDAYREYLNNPAFLKFVGNLNGKKVLDAGCGEGYNTRIFAQRGAKMTGIDISKKMLSFARKQEKIKPLGIRYERASYADLSLFADNSFDAIVSTMALMDSPNYRGAIKELSRILRPGGELYFSISHPCFMTKGYGWIKDEKGYEVKLTVADYFNTRPRIERWKFSKSPVPAETPPFAYPGFYRTISEYINPLIKIGFNIKRIHEPRPTEAICKKFPWLRQWRYHAAIFFYVHAKKPLEIQPL
jgi:ubiquinone/menaquinone biosynthesis C-methylase UbiE